MKIKAAVLREFNKPVSIEEVNLAPPKEREVLIKTAYTGFCHSDLHFIIGVLYGNIHTHVDIPRFADMAMKGDLMLDRMISKKFRVEEINDVVGAMKNRQIIGRWVCAWGKKK